PHCARRPLEVHAARLGGQVRARRDGEVPVEARGATQPAGRPPLGYAPRMGPTPGPRGYRGAPQGRGLTSKPIWDVDDRSTAELMKRLYAALNTGLRPEDRACVFTSSVNSPSGP